MNHKLEAGFNQVIVKELKPSEQTKAGLYVPESDKNYKQGVITSIGPHEDKYNNYECIHQCMIYFGKYAGTEIEFEGTKFISLKMEDIIAVVTEVEDKL